MKKELRWFEDNTGESNCVPTVRRLTNKELEEKLFELGEILKNFGYYCKRNGYGDARHLISNVEKWQEDLK